jgi:hypothetical protein
MAPQDHNKLLGVLHLVYGALNTLLALFFVVLFGVISIVEREPVMFVIMTIVLLIVYALLILPSLLAGYGLLKRKRWAKVFAYISAALAAMSFPHGTALCVYTIWFLTSDTGKTIYDKSNVRASLYDAPPPPPQPFWSDRSKQPEREYVPPPQPPDWR